MNGTFQCCDIPVKWVEWHMNLAYTAKLSLNYKSDTFKLRIALIYTHTHYTGTCCVSFLRIWRRSPSTLYTNNLLVQSENHIRWKENYSLTPNTHARQAHQMELSRSPTDINGCVYFAFGVAINRNTLSTTNELTPTRFTLNMKRALRQLTLFTSLCCI